jgi:hypothetical protein
MQPIHGERGKQYFAIKCGNPQCQENLLLAELPHQVSWEPRRLRHVRQPCGFLTVSLSSRCFGRDEHDFKIGV